MIALFIESNLCHLAFQALPFSLLSAPRIFMKIMAEVMSRHSDYTVHGQFSDCRTRCAKFLGI